MNFCSCQIYWALLRVRLISHKKGEKMKIFVHIIFSLFLIKASILAEGLERYGTPESFAEFHGYVSMEYENHEMDGSYSGIGTFDMHKFAFFAGAKLSPTLLAFAEIEYEHAGEKIALDRAYIENKFSEFTSIRLGRMYAPFGREIYTYQSPLRKFVTRPLPSVELLFEEWIDIGLELFGDIPPISYNLAIMNGPKGVDETDLQHHDNNENKFLVFRLKTNMFGFEPGFSFASGKYDDEEKYLLQFFGADIFYILGPLELRAEYIYRMYDTAVSYKYDSGFYVLGDYKIIEEIYAIARFEGLNKDQSVIDNSDKFALSLGARFIPMEHFKIKTEYRIIREMKGPELANNALLLEAVLDF